MKVRDNRVRDGYESAILGYILYFKNNELNSACQRDVYDIEPGVQEKLEKSRRIGVTKEKLLSPSPFFSVAEAERKSFLMKKEERVRASLLPYISSKIEKLLSMDGADCLKKRIEADGLSTTAERVYYFSVCYAGEIRADKAVQLTYIKDGVTYRTEGAERQKALAEIQKYYSPEEDLKEYFPLYEKYETFIVEHAPEVITAIDTAVALAVKYPGREYESYIKERNK